MPGARDTDWTHVRVDGDRGAVAPYLSYARKLLGFVKEEAARNNLGVHAVTKTFPDGAVVVAEIHGTIPRITIVPPSSGGARELQGLDRFVVFARDDDHTTGIDDDWPEQWLDAPGVTRGDGWMTRFHDAGMPAYESFDGQKGIYAAFEGRPAFQKGVLHYGNIDHYGKNGYRVSWYGPSSRITADAYVNPAVIWRRKVFLHGAELLDTVGYESASPDTGTIGDTVVLGAGTVGLALYVIQAPGLGVNTTTPPSAPPGTAYILSPVAGYTSGKMLYVCRYALVPSVDVPGGKINFKVAANSRKVLGQFDWGLRDQQPWAFNPDCTEATSYSTGVGAGASSTVTLTRTHALDGMNGFELADPAHNPRPPTGADERFTLSINSESASMTIETVSLAAGGGVAVVARDYDKDGNRVELDAWRGSISGDDGILALQMDGQRWPLQARVGDHEIERRYLLHADLPQRTLIFAVCRFTYEDPVDNPLTTAINESLGFGYAVTGGSVDIEIWTGGNLVSSERVSSAALATGLPHYAPLTQAIRGASLWSALNTVAIAPSLLLNGVFFMFSTDLRDPDNPQTNTSIGVFGANPMFGYFAYPPDYSFGWIKYELGTPIKFPADRTSFFSYETDRDGSYTPLSCATLGGFTLLSGYMPTPDDEAESYTYPHDLGGLTGVSGAHTRYHPLWRLGRFDFSPA